MGYVELGVGLSDETKAAQETALKFALEIMRPAGVELDALPYPGDVIEKGSKLWDVARQFRELGFHRAAFAKEVGGIRDDLDPDAGPLLIETQGYGDAGLAVGLNAASLPFQIAALGREPELLDLARAYCADTKGEMIGCWANLEPGPSAGVERVGDEYVIRGHRAGSAPNGSIATHAVLQVPSNSDNGGRNGAVAVIPLDLPGISRGKPVGKMGQRALNHGEIVFEEVKILRQHIVTSDPAKTSEIGGTILAAALGAAGQVCIGLAQAAFDQALSYAKERVQGGVPIVMHNNIKLKLFNMFAMIESSRAFARGVSRYYSSGRSAGLCKHAVALRVVAAETAFKVASEAVQVFGGNGLAREYPVEKMLRDALAAMIENGSNEALALAVADEF
ncbi:MAG TPA: acyl-CoA dehydrogenase family protein [bacterium]|nr:acyl-CoA dehydrogenase family protein [bacterium]